MPRLLSVDPLKPDPAVLAEAAAVLRSGGLVAFPTETVYGLGARALDARAVERIYRAKSRPGWNPVIVHVTGANMARNVVTQWPAVAETLARAFWPGPLSLVLPRAAGVPDVVTAGLPSVGVRVPDHAVARGLIEALGEPIAAPSANRFMHISPTRADHVARSLGDAVDLVLDGGPAAVGVESTVVDLCGPVPRLLRVGGLAEDALRGVIPQVELAEAVMDGHARASPGMVARHYAPAAVARAVPHADAQAYLRAVRELPRPLGALVFNLSAEGADHVERLSPAAPDAQARLYAALHVLEAAGCRGIIVELPPAGTAWDALRDRMDRASR